MKIFFAALFMALCGGILGYLIGPPILADLRANRATLEPARTLTIKEARCRSKLFVLSFCDVKYDGASKGELNYFILSNMGGEPIQLLSPKGKPGPVTSNIGVDYLTNRIVSFVILEGFMAALVIGGLMSLLRPKDA